MIHQLCDINGPCVCTLVLLLKKEICWHLFKIMLLELKKNILWNVALRWYYIIRKTEWLYAWAVRSYISLMKFVCECTSAHYLSFNFRTVFIMKRNILSSYFDSYLWGSFFNGRLRFLSFSCSVAYFLNVISVYYADLCFWQKGSCCYFITASG